MEVKLRPTIVATLRALGLLPYAQKIRMLGRILKPGTIFDNVLFWLAGNKETLPIPSNWARLLVAGSADIPRFLLAGRLGFDCIRETLAQHGKPLETLRDVLDFGCGCGRILRYWSGMANTRIFGTDINGYLVDECRRCVPFATVAKNPLVANLDYTGESFDLVYAFSVFTHLDVQAQKEWLEEFRRILRPGGILLLSTHGAAYRNRLASKELEDFDAGRPVVRLSEYPGANLCVAFHPKSSVRELANRFEILDAVPEGAKGNPPQDLYVLRKPN